jgi:annexin A7/11
MAGAGTNEGTLVEIMTTRSNAEIKAIKESYATQFKRDLEKDIMSETSGHLKRILVSLVQAARDESNHVDHAKAVEQAAQLKAAGEKCIGTDESAFNRIFMTSNKAHLAAVLAEYRKISDYDLIRVIEKEMSGDLENAFINLVESARDVPKLFARLLHKAMIGAGTDDTTLVRVFVWWVFFWMGYYLAVCLYGFWCFFRLFWHE